MLNWEMSKRCARKLLLLLSLLILLLLELLFIFPLNNTLLFLFPLKQHSQSVFLSEALLKRGVDREDMCKEIKKILILHYYYYYYPQCRKWMSQTTLLSPQKPF